VLNAYWRSRPHSALIWVAPICRTLGLRGVQIAPRTYSAQDDLIGELAAYRRGHRQRGLDEIGVHVLLDRPADHPPRTAITHTVSDYWAAACAKAGVKRIRLHDARHTCGTLMHLEHNVPVAIISAWLGHAGTAFTMRTYVHNQPEKLALAAESISSWTRRTKSAQ
jgi:integrase